jgi:toxin YoeB
MDRGYVGHVVRHQARRTEALRHDVAGYWSRRITAEHRLVYKIVDDEVRIASCRYHYG